VSPDIQEELGIIWSSGEAADVTEGRGCVTARRQFIWKMGSASPKLAQAGLKP
jgi:hypothetical protein